MTTRFCANPFFLKTLDPLKKIHCCWMKDNADLAQVQADILADRPSPACKKCWIAEESGVPSKRQTDTKNLQVLTKLSEAELKIYAVNDPTPLLWQVRLGNDCNLACKTCYAGDSTRWYSEWNLRHPNDTYQRPIRLDISQSHSLDYSKVKFIEFLGGEPFVGERYRPYLEKLIEANNFDVMLSFTTNGTVRPPVELLKRFSNVNINISIDGVGRRFDYLRWPARWEEVDANITWWQEQRLGPVSCVHTISNLTIGYLDEFLPFALKRFGVGKYHFNIVEHPRYHAPNVLPAEVKAQITKRYQGHRMAPMLVPFSNLMQHPVRDFTLLRFAVETLRQDEYRNQRMRDYLPEIVFFDDSTVLRKSFKKV
jgi:sulfatase maturation enzyme AslB (radical SAM superfamily)